MKIQKITHHYPQTPITKKSEDNFEKKIKKISKELKIEFLSGIINLKIQRKKNKENLFEISDFENFEHISDLIEEEFEDYLSESKIYKKEYLKKIEEISEIKSVYKKYKWILFTSKKFIFIAFIKKNISNLQIERNFIKISDFLENLKFSKTSLSKIKKNKIKNHLHNLFLKIKAISRLEIETKNLEISSFEEKFRDRSSSVKQLMLPFNEEIIIKKENIQENYFFFNKSIFFALILLAAFFTIWFLIFSQNERKASFKEVKENLDMHISNIV